MPEEQYASLQETVSVFTEQFFGSPLAPPPRTMDGIPRMEEASGKEWRPGRPAVPESSRLSESSELSRLLDIPSVQVLIDDFHALTGIAIGFIDMHGKVMVSAGWQDICTKYHRVHPATQCNCVESDVRLSANVKRGQFVPYKCHNNMWDISTPLYLGDRHVANIFTGQFFYDDEKIDTGVFLAQADMFGFDREAYLEALARVPRFSREKVDAIMRFLARLTEHLASQAYAALQLETELKSRAKVEAALLGSQKRLEANQKKLSLAMDMAGLAPWEYEYGTGLFTFNDRLYALHATTREREGGYGMTPETYASQFLSPEEAPGFFKGIERLGAPGETTSFCELEYPFIRRDGQTRIKLMRCTVIRDKAGRATRLIGVSRDVTDRRRAAEALRKTNSMMREILEFMPSAIIVLDGQGRITHWNRGAESLCGPDADTARGLTLRKASPVLSRLVADASRVAAGEGPLFLEKQAVTLGGETRLLDLLLYPLEGNGASGKVLRVDDVTHKAQLEEMIVQHAKMMSVGTLAGGMAHEINNPLAGILHGVQNIKRRTEVELPANLRVAQEEGVSLDSVRNYLERRQVFEFLDGIQQSGKRAAGIVQNMLGFIRKSSSERVASSLEEIIERAVEIASTDYDLARKFDFRGIELVREFQPDMPLVPCTPSEIEQVIYNLLGNAADAMARDTRRTGPPRLILRLRRDAEVAVVEVEDNGPGMDEAVRRKIFDPFFSTKPPGEGTGLGLAVSYFIVVSSHKGRLSVDSIPGRGANFVIRLPLVHSGNSRA